MRLEDIRKALLKTQAEVLRLQARLEKAEEKIEQLEKENNVEKYASSFR